MGLPTHAPGNLFEAHMVGIQPPVFFRSGPQLHFPSPVAVVFPDRGRYFSTNGLYIAPRGLGVTNWLISDFRRLSGGGPRPF